MNAFTKNIKIILRSDVIMKVTIPIALFTITMIPPVIRDSPTSKFVLSQREEL